MFTEKTISFKVIEVFPNGGVVTHILKGKKKDVQKDIGGFANKRRYREVFKGGMVIWD